MCAFYQIFFKKKQNFGSIKNTKGEIFAFIAQKLHIVFHSSQKLGWLI